MECPVCWESLAAESLASVSIPCGHIFHEKCLWACIQQQVHPAADRTTQGSQPDCPTCRKPLNLPPASIWERVPKELRSYFHPVIRKVFLNGVPVDPGEQTAAEEELQRLRERAAALEAAEGAVQGLRARLAQEQVRTGELQRELDAAALRERAAVAEAQRCKREAGLQWGGGSGSVSYAVAGACASSYGFASSPQQPPAYYLPPPGYDPSRSAPLMQQQSPAAAAFSPTTTTNTMYPNFGLDLDPPSAGPSYSLASSSSSSSASAVPMSAAPYHYADSLSTDRAHAFDGLLLQGAGTSAAASSFGALPLPLSQPQAQQHQSQQYQSQPAALGSAYPSLGSAYPSPAVPGSAYPHPHPPPRAWSHAQREKRLDGARAQSYQQLHQARLFSAAAAAQRRPSPQQSQTQTQQSAYVQGQSQQSAYAQSQQSQQQQSQQPYAQSQSQQQQSAHAQQPGQGMSPPFVYSPAQVMGPPPGAPMSFPSF